MAVPARVHSRFGTPSAAAALFAAACAAETAGAPVTIAPAATLTSPAAPKYPAFCVPLSRDAAYLRRAVAADFWALMPYYVGQQDGISCSLASLTMLVNAARHSTPLGSNDELVSQSVLRRRVASAIWEHGLAPGGEGVTLDELASVTLQSLRVYGLVAERVQVTHVPAASPRALAELRRTLGASEMSDRDFVLVNFFARAFVGVGDYGHIAPVGAYDAAQRRVLILDPDRTWYEPYWIPDEVALEGMATNDATSGKPRGYLYVSLCPASGCRSATER